MEFRIFKFEYTACFTAFSSKKDEKAVKHAAYSNLKIRNSSIQGVLQIFRLFPHIFEFEDKRFEYTEYFK